MKSIPNLSRQFDVVVQPRKQLKIDVFVKNCNTLVLHFVYNRLCEISIRKKNQLASHMVEDVAQLSPTEGEARNLRHLQ